MFTPRNLIVAGIAGCALVLATAGTNIFDPLGPQPALAKDGNGGGNSNGNGGGNGGGNGNGGGTGGGNGNGNGNGGGPSSQSSSSPGKSASAQGQNKASDSSSVTVAKASALAVDKAAKAPGLDAKVAGLHAVNANLQAFIHASPNSRVGRIAAYAMATVAVEDATVARDVAQGAFDAALLTLSEATDAHNAAVAVLTDVYGYADTSSDALQASKDALLLADTSAYTPVELAAYNAEVAAIDQALAEAAALAAAQMAYDDANQTLMNAEQNLADAGNAATDAFNAAGNANRIPVNDAVKTYVDTKLEQGGILDYYRAQDPSVVVE